MTGAAPAPIAPSATAAADNAGFSRATVLGLLLVGAVAFIALLWFLGNNSGGNANDGGGHVGGKGLNGFAGIAALLEADGLEVNRVRAKDQLANVGLLVLTPPPGADGKAIDRIVSQRRYAGPTLVVTPKWIALPTRDAAAKKGWVQLAGAAAPEWPGFHDDVMVKLADGNAPKAGGWQAIGQRGRLPDEGRVLSGEGRHLVPLVTAGDGRILAAYVADAGSYPDLERFAGVSGRIGGDDTRIYPVVFVFEPDLIDNWGMADEHTALMARELMLAAAGTRSQPVSFDLTLDGFGGSPNLLTLAFRPPFLAATICLLLAGVAIAWRAFNRFGPPRAATRAIAMGKTALVANSAGFIRRTGRVHLVAAPYADAARDRIAAALGLPRGVSVAETEAAIDSAQQRRAIAIAPFSQAAAQLRAAHKPHDVARRAAVVQSIERALT
ncbi:hypothetical protein [Novosphingobium lentum]|uniref:hypothetical protein n=1 Tax=Novosphingobium lentum TaxID=145287 RepID=UPI00082F801A|nr:hypothetical protein [Novosphingobium lentum]